MKTIKNDCAVSPVVAVMLMLVVTIIIAAVISGFAGGLIGDEEKAPMLAMDVSIKNNGYWSGSSFCARVTGVEKAIPTSDLKLVTRWTKVYSNGTTVDGGATVLPGVNNTFVYYSHGMGAIMRMIMHTSRPWGSALEPVRMVKKPEPVAV